MKGKMLYTSPRNSLLIISHMMPIYFFLVSKLQKNDDANQLSQPLSFPVPKLQEPGGSFSLLSVYDVATGS